ncbi:hypothetical protein DWB77_07405 [Streptomyces hundungensis]|uniref:Uncharacterized protein n=1 Tax=Streptomyces hundungensis TaxID=1077946 RepID=A0A387HSM1_9ACTN|nr:hypothetical protein [Streptomyces hundungensis]AYG85188.1 hypothetical protein DWB77_07405 [Streptomyces hundungensis]
MGTSPHPMAVVIASQPVKVAASVPRSSSGYGAGNPTAVSRGKCDAASTRPGGPQRSEQRAGVPDRGVAVAEPHGSLVHYAFGVCRPGRSVA